jgi:hypothetical protein
MTFNSIQNGNNLVGSGYEEFAVLIQAKADAISDWLSLPSYPVEIKAVNCGRARFKTDCITIPTWLRGRHPKYVFYYVMHEVIHFKFKAEGRAHEAHTRVYRDYEAACCEAWGVRLVFKGGAYPAYICDTEGMVVCGSRGRRTSVA